MQARPLCRPAPRHQLRGLDHTRGAPPAQSAAAPAAAFLYLLLVATLLGLALVGLAGRLRPTAPIWLSITSLGALLLLVPGLLLAVAGVPVGKASSASAVAAIPAAAVASPLTAFAVAGSPLPATRQPLPPPVCRVATVASRLCAAAVYK